MLLVDAEHRIHLRELSEMTEAMFGDLVKVVVDINKGTMAVDAELHADQEAFPMERGSDQNDLWGINLYPELEGDALVKFDAMINLRSSQGNRSRGVEDPEIRDRILTIVKELVIR